MKLASAVMFLALLIPLSAQAMTGNDLFRYCKIFIEKPSEDYVRAGECAGFIEGVMGRVDAMATSVTRDYDHYRKPQQICIPELATRGQIIRVVVNYLEENPGDLHRHAGSLTFIALLRAFPCGKPRQ